MNAMGIVFSYSIDDNLKELTEKRAIASVPFGGRYRIIDFVLSNLVNSGISNVGIITQSNYQSLLDHLGSGKEWDLSRKRDGLFILPPFARTAPTANNQVAFRGWLEALASVFTYIRRSKNKYVILTGCENICNIDMEKVLESHIANNADITCVYRTADITSSDSRHSVVYEVDQDHRIMDMLYRPSTVNGHANVDMGIFVMEKSFLETLVSEAAARNNYSLFKDVIQRRVGDYRIYGYCFEGFAAKIDSVRSYFRANMELLNMAVGKDLFTSSRPIYTKVRDEVPTLYSESASVRNSLMADGCVIEGEVENSILFRGVCVEKGARISNSIIMQGSIVQKDVRLNYAIVDKDSVIREGRMLMGYESHPVMIEKGVIV
jgi:glucose-1-phosphate adenylyltransferase